MSRFHANATVNAPVIALLMWLSFSGCGSQPVPPTPAEPKVQCRSPNKPDAQPTAVAQWKFDAVQAAVLSILTEERALPSQMLPQRVPEAITEEEIDRLGNLNWLVEKVRLEMEVRGEIERTTLPTGHFILHLPGAVKLAPMPEASAE